MNFFLRTYTWNSTRKYHSHTIVQRSKKEKENHKHESSKYTRINETAGTMKLYYLQIYHNAKYGPFHCAHNKTPLSTSFSRNSSKWEKENNFFPRTEVRNQIK